MFAFAFAARFQDGGPDPTTVVERMVAAWPYHRPTFSANGATANAAASLLIWPVLAGDEEAKPFVDARRGRLAVGDVRLYNRLALASGPSAKANDLEPFANVDVRSRNRFLTSIVGDFAYVDWQDESGSVFAVRDHFGVRPLYYFADELTFIAATDPTQILVALPSRARVDPRTILDRLVGIPSNLSRSFFDQIKRVPPGHTLECRRGRQVRVRRYWRPVDGDAPGSYREQCARVRDVFIEAVNDRLRSSLPIAAHSSGGVDSSSIVMAASRLRREGRTTAPIILLSGTAKDHAVADRGRISVVSQRAAFDGLTWDLFDESQQIELDRAIGSPSFNWGLAGGPPFDTNIARQRGAGILLTGVLGDTLMSAFGILRDFFRHGIFREVFGHVLGHVTFRHGLKLLGRASLGLLSPDVALSLIDRRDDRPAEWMGPRLIEQIPATDETEPVMRYSSHLRTELWSRLSGAYSSQTIDAMVLHGMRDGLEVRLPFADHRILAAVFAIPWSNRAPRGDGRRLSWDVLGELLPAEFAGRADQESWMPAWLHHARRTFPLLQEQLASRWKSGVFVRRSVAATMLERAGAGACSPAEQVLLSQFAVLNAWLLKLHRLDMCDI